MLRKNQQDAINASIHSDFSSGVHFHCTGSGKSLIAFHILVEFHNRHPTKNVFWICEQKTILQQHFTKTKTEKSMYSRIRESTNYFLFDFSQIKNPEWYLSLNNMKFWGKPYLCIINRSFLVSFEKYKNITNPIDFVIHDECHSALNKTSSKFYEYVIEKFQTRCIGFTATPCATQCFPFQKILSSYTIYDAVRDKIIVPPKIEWIGSHPQATQKDNLIPLVKERICELPFKKIIVWCGMIEHCFAIARKWKSAFSDFTFHIDISRNQPLTECEFQSYESFAKSAGRAFLFCASKHREGSDIFHLDGAIFMDQVHTRNAKTFVQCVGRVLRKENEKSFGWILDTHTKGVSAIRSSINKFFFIAQQARPVPSSHSYIQEHAVPWDHYVTEYPHLSINLHTLTIRTSESLPAAQSGLDESKNITKDELIGLFKRPIPDSPIYRDRLNRELDVIMGKKLEKFLLRAMKILKISNDVIHVTRGSCGSSLICYLLNISHVDPIQYNIKFERFLTEYRNNMPDIDLDFPYNVRDNIFAKIEQSFPGKIARISNHVFYKEKSALRESLRKNGVRRFISKENLRREIQKMNQAKQKKIFHDRDQILNTFRQYMLHCGGIIYYENGIPDDKIIAHSRVQNQVTLNKHQVSDEKHFKIDILSSRSLSIFNECWTEIYGSASKLVLPENVDAQTNKKIFEMLGDGNNIGLILGESPLIRKAFMAIQCKNIYDIAKCLAVIRPASTGAFGNILKAKNQKDRENGKIILGKSDNGDKIDEQPEETDETGEIIFDDDVIELISRKIGISLAKADNVRRIFAKSDMPRMKEFYASPEFKKLSKQDKACISKQLKSLSKYSFCKSHALSYAQLIYSLAYTKVVCPQIFWKHVYIHAQTMYKKFVYESLCFKYGVDYRQYSKSNSGSIYAINKRTRKFRDFENLSVQQQFEKYSTWDFFKFGFYPNCYFRAENAVFYFRGLVAVRRRLRKMKIALFLICYDFEKFFELAAPTQYYKKCIIDGKCTFQPEQINYLLIE